MNLKDLMEQTYRELGNPSDLDINAYDAAGVATFDNSTVGSGKMIALLNRAYKRLTMYKQPNGVHIKFRDFYKFVYFRYQDISKTVYGNNGKQFTVINAGSVYGKDQFKGSYVIIDNDMKLILGNDATDTINDRTIFYCYDDVHVTVDYYIGYSAVLLMRRIPIIDYTATVNELQNQEIMAVNDSAVISIMRMINVSQNDMEVMPAGRTFMFFDRPQGRQNPTIYRQLGSMLELNYVPVNDTVFRVEYYGACETLSRDALDVTTCNQVPVIAEVWHDVISMIAVAIRLREDKNIEEAIAKDREIDKLIMQLLQETEHGFDINQMGLNSNKYFGGY